METIVQFRKWRNWEILLANSQRLQILGSDFQWTNDTALD